jgi:hypothetical protein
VRCCPSSATAARWRPARPQQSDPNEQAQCELLSPVAMSSLSPVTPLPSSSSSRRHAAQANALAARPHVRCAKHAPLPLLCHRRRRVPSAS